MSYFGLGGMWGAKDVKKETKPEQRGLEIIVGDAPISVKYDGKNIGRIYKNDGVYEFTMDPATYRLDGGNCFYGNYDSLMLKGIAAKLDELNCVDIDRNKLAYELQVLSMINVYNKSKSEIQSINKRISEIKNILNNP